MAVINRMLAAPAAYTEDLQHMIFELSSRLNDDDPAVRERAFGLLDRVLDAAITALHELEAQHTSAYGTWPPADIEQYDGFLRDIDEVAKRIYFASGAFTGQNAEPRRPNAAFYDHARPLLRKLAPMGHPHTVHHVIHTLAYFAPLDPVGVLMLIGQVVQTGSSYGYQYEVLGENLITQFVERYLAEYRPILREHRECHAVLMDILDVFVRVGWPRAHQLTYRLSEIYR
jgi:hypothetical protein